MPVDVQVELNRLSPRQLKWLAARYNTEQIIRLVELGKDTGLDLLKILLSNPAISLTLAFVAIEWLQNQYYLVQPLNVYRPYMPDFAGGALETALASSAFLSALGGGGGLASLLAGIAGLVK